MPRLQTQQKARAPTSYPSVQLRHGSQITLAVPPLTVHLIKIFNQCISTWQLWAEKKHTSFGFRYWHPKIGGRWMRLIWCRDWTTVCVCVCVQAHFVLDFMFLFFFVRACAIMKPPPPPPWHCLLITQICAQSEEIMNESFNYASRQRIPDASTQHCWHAEMGEGRLNRNPFLWVQKAGQPWIQTEPAAWRDAGERREEGSL